MLMKALAPIVVVAAMSAPLASPAQEPEAAPAGAAQAVPRDSASPSKAGGELKAPAADTDRKGGGKALRPPPADKVNLGVAVTLTILPGFGAGHFYADDVKRGITYCVADGAIWGFGISSFILHALTVAPDYTKVAMIIFPLIWAALKGVEIYDIVEAVEVANNRTLRPVSTPGLEPVPAMATLLRF
jgi:TM2 domain-containing membrane protein YozV